MKILSTIIILISVSLSAGTAESIDYQKDIQVFEGILKTMLGVEDTERSFRHGDYDHHVKGTYLKKQGLLIEIDTRFLAESMISYRPYSRLRLPEIEMPPMLYRHFEDLNIEVPELEMELEQQFEEEAEQAALEAMQESEERIALELEARELDREQDWLDEEREFLEKELQQKLELAEKQKALKKAQIAKELTKFKEQVKKNKVKASIVKEELERQMKHQREAMKQYKEQLEDIKSKHEENWSIEADKIKSSIVDALCQYGASIRTVKDDEFFTVILKGFEHDDSGERVNRIYIFSKESILSCRDGAIDQKQLLSMSESYLSK